MSCTFNLYYKHRVKIKGSHNLWYKLLSGIKNDLILEFSKENKGTEVTTIIYLLSVVFFFFWLNDLKEIRSFSKPPLG